MQKRYEFVQQSCGILVLINHFFPDLMVYSDESYNMVKNVQYILITYLIHFEL